MSNKLISLSERVDQILDVTEKAIPYTRIVDGIEMYNEFLKTDLLSNYTAEGKEYHYLNRFVPCDLEGNVLEPVIQMDYIPQVEGYSTKHPQECYEEDLKTYQDHLSKVWFDGEWSHSRDDRYTYMNWLKESKTGKSIKMHECKLIQDLTEYDLTLTLFASKLAGYENN